MTSPSTIARRARCGRWSSKERAPPPGSRTPAGAMPSSPCSRTTVPSKPSCSAMRASSRSLRKGAIHVSMSTISVALSERLAAAHATAGQRFVAAPVFGRPEAAAAGKLFIVAAGAPDVVDACSPLFDAMGQKTFPLGDEPPGGEPRQAQRQLPHRLGDRGAGRGDGARRQGRRRSASISRSADLHALHRAGVQDLRRADRRAEVRARGIRRAAGSRRTSASPSPRRRRFACPMPLASLLHDRFLTPARARRRGARLVGDRTARGERRRSRRRPSRSTTG